MFFGGTRFRGEYDPSISYKKNDLVKVLADEVSDDTSVYRCIVKENIGSDPKTTPTIWEAFLPITTATVLGVATVNEVKEETFGDGTGGIWEWKGEEWRLEQNGELLTLVRVLQHCNCVCECQCDCECACICVNCKGHMCVCADTDPPFYYHVPFCVGFLDCPPQCACACLCTGECNCMNTECSACGTECDQCVCVGMCQCDICQGTLCEGVCVCNCG